MHENFDIDEFDRRILRILERDGRLPNTTLAECVGLSPSACLRRVRRLERRGIIRGYRAVLDRQALGRSLLAYVAVGLDEHTGAAQTAFERAIAAVPEVRECHNVTGNVEYLLRVETADLAAYKRFHTDVLGSLPHVRTIQTYVVLASPKDERG